LKKLAFIIFVSLSFIFITPTTSVLARAGGSMGSSSTSTSSSYSSNDSNNYYRGYRGYNNYGYGRFSLINMALIGFVGFSFIKSIRNKRQNNYTLPETYAELTPQLNTSFEPFFYQVEDAWTKNDLRALNSLMSPHYFSKQKRIINTYIRNHKIDHLEGLVIIDLQQVADPPNGKVQIIVTAQARDYFQYDNKSVEYNQQIQEDTNIERFTEIWTMKFTDNAKLQLCDIRTIS